MPMKSLVKLVLVLLVLATLVWVVRREPDGSGASGMAEGGVLLPDLDVNAVRGLVVSEGSNKVELAYHDGLWHVVSAWDYFADFARLSGFLRSLADLEAGQVMAGDVVVAIRNSGETGELRLAVEAVRALGARVIAVTGGARSWLAHNADAVLDAGVAREGGGLGFAPRASVAAEVLVMAALSAALEEVRGFSRLTQPHKAFHHVTLEVFDDARSSFARNECELRFADGRAVRSRRHAVSHHFRATNEARRGAARRLARQ